MKKRKTDLKTVRQVLSLVRPHSGLVGLSLLMAVGQAGLQLTVPRFTGRAVDLIVRQGSVDFEGVARLLVILCLVSAGAALFQYLMGVCNARTVNRVVRDLRTAAFRRFADLPLSYLDSHPSGETVSRVMTDVDTLADGLLLGFSQLFTGVVTILGTLFFMLSANASIALIVVLITPLSLFVAAFIASRTHHLFEAQSKARAVQTALVDEMLTGQKVIGAFGDEDTFLRRFDDSNEALRDASRKAIFYSSLTNPATRFVNALVYAGVGVFGALRVLKGELTVGGLHAFLAYASQYTKPFNEISGVVTELENALVCAERVFRLIGEEPEPHEKPAVLPQAKGAVGVNSVSFSYVPEKPLMNGLTVSAQPGQRVAIVGPTGCGKTTLINLLMRFYDVNAGSITVDGTDIRDVTRHSLRRSYGMVLQDTWLRAGTIRENLLFGRADATEEEMIRAARAAHADSFIRRLPQGYDTVIGEDGGALSQGQKQLLCIARVMLCLPPMLILDEATSSIDTRTEMKIQSAFARLMEGRTTFIVAHRLSTIRGADCILVMRDGQVVEQGTHEELLARKGFYAQLYQSQYQQAQSA